MSKHTPGPWIVGSSKYGHIYAHDHYPVATVTRKHIYGVREELIAEANARLIAAAPELLEALKAMLSEFNEQMAGVVHDELSAIAKARAAIAKAEGNMT